MDCKNALNETGGDLDKAVQALREAGLGKAAKKAGNVAAEGLVAIEINSDNTKAVILELNAQTDFVAKNENFINLQDELAGTENRISVARQDYNDAAKEYNTKIQSFPASIIAGLFHFEKADYFTATAEAATVPAVDFGK